MKKLLILLVCALTAAICALPFAACGKGSPVKVKDIELTQEDYAFAVKKENNELLTQINGYLTEWENDGTLESLINSYFNGTAEFSYKNKSNTAQSGDFVVATNAYFPPFESYDKNSDFVGIDIEIAYKIAQKLNKTLFIKDMDFDSIIPSVKAGESAIGMAGITVNEDRLKDVAFAKGYYTSAQVLTVLQSDTTFDNCTSDEEVIEILKQQSKNYKIGAQAGTTGYMFSAGDEGFGYEGFANLETKAYNTGALAIKDLSNGKINAVILDKQPSLMIAETINKTFN